MRKIRIIAAVCAGIAMASALSGCVVVPVPFGVGFGGYGHGHYYRR
ncbi:MAG TPA: hypothetical protein VGM74_18510 [Burkholderiaceae bacterium]|jgi:hypothetical protein